MKIVVVGGVAAGASAAARARRLNEAASIIVLERGQHVSFANCGLPYHVGGVIKERDKLLLQTPQSLKASLSMDVMGIKKEELVSGVEFGGVAAFREAANRSGTTLFI